MSDGVVRDQQTEGLGEIEWRTVFCRPQQWLAIDQMANERAGAGFERKHFNLQAVAQYQSALSIQPNNALILNNLAWAAGQAKSPKAIEYAEKANRLAPGQPAIMDTLGVLLVERGESGRGLELLQKAVELAPQASAIRLNYARALLKTGKKGDAKQELDALAKLGDKFPEHAEVDELLKKL